MKADQERVKTLLTDTVTLLCKNGLQYNKELKVQGLLGITLDNDDVFVVHINEIFDGLIGGQLVGLSSGTTSAIADSATQPSEKDTRKSQHHHHHKKTSPSPSPHRTGKRKSHHHGSQHAVKIKKELVEDDDDDLLVVDAKGQQFIPSGNTLSSGDREAMRLSYGGAVIDSGGPDRRIGDSSNTSESFSEVQSDLGGGGPFITGMVKNAEKGESDILADPSSLDNAQLVGLGDQVFDGTPGCSQWDNSQDQSGLDEMGEGGSQDSLLPPGCSDELDTLTAEMGTFSDWHTSFKPGAPSPVKKNTVPSTCISSHLVVFRRDKNSPGKRYPCQFPGCDKAFFRGPERNRHQKLKHGGLFTPQT